MVKHIRKVGLVWSRLVTTIAKTLEKEQKAQRATLETKNRTNVLLYKCICL